MATKPDAARGKTTRKGRIKKIFEKLKQQGKGKKTLGMSPGAMGGRTKTKMPDLKRRPLTRTPARKQLQGMVPMIGKATKSTIKGAGASGIGMAGQAMKLAKKLKTTGRLSVDDLMRAKQMMMRRKGK